MPSKKVTPAPLTRPLSAIAAEIKADYAAKGKPVYYAAAPYVDAMAQLSTLDDRYYADSAEGIVLYALGNLTTWRGETARKVKEELNAALADYKQRR